MEQIVADPRPAVEADPFGGTADTRPVVDSPSLVGATEWAEVDWQERTGGGEQE